MTSLTRRRVPSSSHIRSEEGPLVNRIEEMNVLKETLDRLIRGEGSFVFIHGEAGIGKTRLVRELSIRAKTLGVQVLFGRRPALSGMDRVPPYTLWKEVIKDYLDICTPEQLKEVIGFYPAEIAKLVPELGQKLRAIPQSFPINPEQEQNRLFEAVSQLIRNISKETPLLVILDDLQWTDPSSLRLLLYLAHDVEKTPLLLLGAYRSTEIDEQHPLTPILTELKRESLSKSFSLKRMTLEDNSEIIKQILKQNEIPQEFCETVYEKTKGNPFFTQEVIESLKEEELIFREDNQWKTKEIRKIRFPETVKSVIKARISHLDEECQNALTIASFIGNDFSFEELSATTRIEEDKLLGIMERMLKTGLIKERVIRGKDEYSFADPIARDVLHEEVSQSRYRRLHGEIGRALESVHAKQIDEYLGKLAYHFMEGGEQDKALKYFLRAGEKSQEMYAYDEAFSYLSHALVLLEEKEASLKERARVTERLGDIKTWTGQWDAGLDYWNKALEFRTLLEDAKSVSGLHIKMAHAFWSVAGDKVKASEHHQMALDILEKEPDSSELASLYEDIGHRLWRSGESEASSWLKKGLALAERLGDSRVLAECYDDLGAVTIGDLEKTRRYWEQGLRIAVINNNLEAALRLYCNLSELYWLIGEPQKALETIHKGLELAKKVGDLNLLLWLNGNLASSYSSMGDLRRALDVLEIDLAMAKRTKNLSHIPTVLLRIGECYLWLGEWGKSLQYLTEAVDMAKQVREFGSLAMGSLRLGELLMGKGDFNKAEKYFAESASICEKAGERTGLFFEVYPDFSRLYIKEGALEKAEEFTARILEFSVETKNNVLLAIAEMLKAMLFSVQNNWEQSIQHFQKSFQVFKDLNAQKWYTLHFGGLLYEYGSTLLERSEGDDIETAHDLLKQALGIFQKRSAKKDIERAEAKLTHIETEIAGQAPSELKSTDHISTGYDGLNKLLYGGIPSGCAVVLTSPSCNERDLLIKSFLETGAKKNEATFYVTINPGSAKTLAEEYQSNFRLFICNPQADAIIKDLPNVFKLKGVENLTDVNIALTSAIRSLDPSLKGPGRICIGLVSDILLQHHAVQTRRWLVGLIPELQSEGFTTLAVMDPQIHPSEELYAILGLFGGEISIYEKETEKGTGKYLKIRKMGDQKYHDSELLLTKTG